MKRANGKASMRFPVLFAKGKSLLLRGRVAAENRPYYAASMAFVLVFMKDLSTEIFLS